MVYNPISNEWMPRAESELATADDSAAAGGEGGDSNRYARSALTLTPPLPLTLSPPLP